jgi:hypothetical protein
VRFSKYIISSQLSQSLFAKIIFAFVDMSGDMSFGDISLTAWALIFVPANFYFLNPFWMSIFLCLLMLLFLIIRVDC